MVRHARGLLFGGLSPPNKKITSLRPWRLCDENFILDKYVLIYEIDEKEQLVTLLDFDHHDNIYKT